MHTVHEFLAAHRGAIADDLAGWVRVPSVAGMPEHRVDLLRSANWLAGSLRAAGFPQVEVWPTEGGPAVYAQWCAAPDAPTVLIYSHHDVRAAKDEQWQETAPFEPVLRDGYLYGRGASDAKGQVLAHRLDISTEAGQEPYATPEHPALERLAAAVQEGFGRPAGRMGNAGGGPADLLATTLDAPVLFFGTGLPEDRWHDSDERISLDVLSAGAATLAAFWSGLAEA